MYSGKLDPTIINGGIINAYSKNNRLGFGKWILFTSIIFTFVSTIDTFIIGKKLSLVELGFYAIAARWGYLVLLQLTPALQKVLFPIFSSSNNVSEIKESYLYSLYFLGIISFPISSCS